MASCQKKGIILVTKWFKNWFYQKMSITKHVLLNWYSSMKKTEKYSNDFWHRKLNLKVKFWHFLTPPHCTNSQNSIISLSYDGSWAKNFLILYPPFENSTTRITIKCKFYSHDESDIRKRVFELKGRIPEYVDHVDLMLTISHSKTQLHIFMEGNSKLT